MAAFKRARAELELYAAIRTARAANVSWRAIGETIGTSGETARHRYSTQTTAPHVNYLRSVAEDALTVALARTHADQDHT